MKMDTGLWADTGRTGSEKERKEMEHRKLERKEMERRELERKEMECRELERKELERKEMEPVRIQHTVSSQSIASTQK